MIISKFRIILFITLFGFQLSEEQSLVDLIDEIFYDYNSLRESDFEDYEYQDGEIDAQSEYVDYDEGPVETDKACINDDDCNYYCTTKSKTFSYGECYGDCQEEEKNCPKKCFCYK